MSLFFSIGRQVIVLILALWCGLFLMQKIDLPVADIGRHIQNGSVIIQGSNTDRHGVLYTNFYSYTEPNHEFINHHWLSGVVFYFVHNYLGFEGLSVFYIGLVSLAFILALVTAKKLSNWTLALTVGVLVLPIITQRVEIRPEGFTYLFLAVFYWVLSFYFHPSPALPLKGREGSSGLINNSSPLRGEVRRGWRLCLLPIVMLFWVNLHIGFIFGFLILGTFLLTQAMEDFRQKLKDKNYQISGQLKHLIGVFIGCLGAGLLNPFGLRGLLYPLNIFREYGYRIVENQSVSFLENLGIVQNMNFGLFKFLVVLTLLSFMGVAIKQSRMKKLAIKTGVQFLLFLTIASLAFLAIRNFPIFGLLVLPILARNLFKLLPVSEHLAYKLFPNVIMLSVVLFGSLVFWQHWQSTRANFGIGLLPQVEASAEFFKNHKLAGPIFNNYDVGGYLIFELFELAPAPSLEKRGRLSVFTDNRPEAYSLGHFQQEYIPAQEDDAKWESLVQKYQFNVIFFSRRDLTPWGQNFLVARVKDALWVPVFVDSYNIIFVKQDNPANAEVIKQYAIPKEMFGLSAQ